MNYIVIIAVVCAYIIKGLCGFANTLVFSTILGFTSNNIEISPVELLVGYPANLLLCWKERKSLTRKIWAPLAVLVILGSIPGAFLLKLGDVKVIKTIFGFIVMGIGVEMFFRERKTDAKESSKWVLEIIGIISGVLCGLFGIGALLAAYVSRTTKDTGAFRGNLSIVFLIENTFRIFLYSFTGIITTQLARTSVKLLPVMVVGLLIGMLLTKVLSEKKVKIVVIIMLILSGASLVINQLIQ